jgi:pimeloyl-ACP methyl ester carboxylesterase
VTSARINGITMAYDDTTCSGVPGAPPLLLVHGHPFDRTMWRPQQDAAPGHRVITPDLRGYGGTQVVPGITPLSTFAHDLAALLDHLEEPRAVLCGLSMGGQIVLEFHRLFPGRVAGLVLADTFAQGETGPGRKERNDRADRLLREGMSGYAHEVLGSMVSPATSASLPEVAAHVLGMMLAAPPEGAAAALRGRAERPDYTAMLPAVAVPALVVVGRDDVFTPVVDAEFLHRRIPGARLAVIDGAGHLPNLERPAAFNDALSGLLADVRRSAREARM